MFAKGHCHLRKVVARCAVFVHVTTCAERVLRHCAEMSELRAVLLRSLICGNEIVLRYCGAFDVRARPRISSISAYDGRRHAGVDRHSSQRDRRIWLAPPLPRVVLKLRVNAEPSSHHLVMGIDIVRAAHDNAVHVLVRKARFVERILGRFLQQGERVFADPPK